MDDSEPTVAHNYGRICPEGRPSPSELASPCPFLGVCHALAPEAVTECVGSGHSVIQKWGLHPKLWVINIDHDVDDYTFGLAAGPPRPACVDAVRRTAGPTSGSVCLPIPLHLFRCSDNPAQHRQWERERAHR
jgi:hypothetical protein